MFTPTLAEIVNTKRKLLDKFIKPLNICRVEWQILAYLVLDPTIKTQKQLVNIADSDKTCITRSLDKLEEKQMLKREIDPADKRQRLIYLTELGQETTQQLFAAAQDINDAMLAGFSPEEKSQLDDFLDRLKHNVLQLKEKQND